MNIYSFGEHHVYNIYINDLKSKNNKYGQK